MPKVIIVGAGASGIAAAVRLYEQGVQDIILLEAENRIGGRVCTVPFAGNDVDMGAQWCHGQVGNVVHELVKDLDLLSSSTMYKKPQFVTSRGELIDSEKSSRLLELHENITDNCEDGLRNYQHSLGDYATAEYYSVLKSNANYSSIDKTLADQFLDVFQKFENSMEGSDTWFDVSGKGYLEYWTCDGDQGLNWRTRGYKTILDVLMKKYPDPTKAIPIDDKIILNKEVSSIEWQRSSGQHPALVTCQDGSSYEADIVIVTTSLGVLKERHQSLFVPSLPEFKTNAINGLTLGTVDKIYLEFSTPWWPEEWNGFNLLWTKEDKAKFQPELAGDGDKRQWLQDVFGFYRVDFQPNILLGWVTGPSARTMESLSEDEVLSGCVDLIDRFLGRMYNLTRPISMKRTTWFSNPHFRGSYSFRSMESERVNATAEQLAAPLPVEGQAVLQFAGEATHSHYYSTVHGAIASGFREADRIVKSFIPKMFEKTCKILIVGAGAAGLSAAHVLLRTHIAQSVMNQGYKLIQDVLSKTDVIVLEAQSQAGGRIRSVALGSKMVECGAQWIHGAQNELFEIASKHNLLTDESSSEGQGLFIRDDGYIFDNSLVQQVDLTIGKILEECESFVTRDFKNLPRSVDDYLTMQFNEHLKQSNDSDDIKLLKSQLFNWHVRFQVIDNSCMSLKDLSAKAWGRYSFNGEPEQAHINFKHCYSSLIDILCTSIPDGIIRYDSPVSQIFWDECTSVGNDAPVVVKCEDGKLYCADCVVVTSSLGVLKHNHRTMFKPGLPDIISRTIQDMGFSGINKIFLQFDKPWWGDIQGFQVIWTDNKSSHNEKPESWIYDISGFDVVNPGSPNTLLAWVGGQGAHLVESRSEEEVTEDCMRLLQRLSNRPDLQNPIKLIRTQWISNPYIRGGYSHTTPACDLSGSRPSSLHAPLMDSLAVPRVLFAGEACHENYFSTVHGAIQSGIHQGKFILDYLDK